MCLWTKTDLPGPEFDGYCYKVIKEYPVGVWVGGITAGTSQVQLKGNRWTSDPKDSSLLWYCQENQLGYSSGFHCFLKLTDAEAVRECVQRWSDRESKENNKYLTAKVRVRNIVAAGEQGWNRGWGIGELNDMPSIVAREIRFVKRMP